MQIRSVGIALRPAMQDPAVKPTPPSASADEPLPTTAVADASTPQSPPAEEATLPGVIRLLQQGHFTGVADVRLRIVHHEQLTALANQQTAAVLNQSTTDLVARIVADVNAFSQSQSAPSTAGVEASITTFAQETTVL